LVKPFDVALFATFANLKGGVGKTTCAILAANAFSQTPFNLRVALVDCDLQKSAVRLRLLDLEDFDGVLPYDVLDWNIPTFEARAQELNDNFDLVLVDVAGTFDDGILRIINYLDAVYIPVTGGNFALEASLSYLRELLAFKAQRAAEGRPLKIYAFANMERTGTRNTRFLSDELDRLRSYLDVPILSAGLKDLNAYRDADSLTTIYRTSPTDPAGLNFAAWIEALYKTFGQ
jgi:cellulose biosynthesis protein BcsQ